MIDIDAFLRQHDIPFERIEHPAVFTVEESSKLPPMPGAGTKNLFLRDAKGSRNILVVVAHEKRVDLKGLKPLLAADKLSFADPERLMRHLGVTPGSVTLLGLANDTDHAVEVVIDEELWNADAMQCHPLTNTATCVIPHDGILAFLKATGHEARILDVPARHE